MRRQVAAPDSLEIRAEMKAGWRPVRLGPALLKRAKHIRASSQRCRGAGRGGRARRDSVLGWEVGIHPSVQFFKCMEVVLVEHLGTGTETQKEDFACPSVAVGGFIYPSLCGRIAASSSGVTSVEGHRVFGLSVVNGFCV